MAQTKYTFSKASDTTQAKVVGGKLKAEIEAETNITTSLDHINTGGDDIDVYMADDITSGYVWEGHWDSGTTYQVNDMVADGGEAYYCILEHSNQQPPNATYWTQATGQIDYLAAVVYAHLGVPDLGEDKTTGRGPNVIDKDLTAPPGSPSTGDTYIPAATASGAWAGHEDDIAEYDGSDWAFGTPSEGASVWVEDEDKFYVYGGASWNPDLPRNKIPLQLTVNNYVSTTEYQTLLPFCYDGSSNWGTIHSIHILARVDNAGASGSVRIYDVTNAETIAEKTSITGTVYTHYDMGTVSNIPSSTATLEIQAKTTSNKVYVATVSLEI
jgi:hypothetical protein